jgi:hypothetical protein
MMRFWSAGASRKKEEEVYEVPFEYYDENYASGSDSNSQSEYSQGDSSHHYQQNNNPNRPSRDYVEEDETETSEFVEDDRRLSGPPPTQHVFQHHNRPGIPPQQRPIDPVFKAPTHGKPSSTTNRDKDDHAVASSPPSKNAFVHLASQAAAYQQSPLRYLTRQRPLDPVFKAPAGSFPLLVEGEQKLHSPKYQKQFKVFDPSAASRSIAADPMGLDEPKVASLDGGVPAVAPASKPFPRKVIFVDSEEERAGEKAQPRSRPPKGKKQQTNSAPPPTQAEPVAQIPEIPAIPMAENDNVVDSNPQNQGDDDDHDDVVVQDGEFVKVEQASEPELDTREQQYHEWLEAQQNQGNAPNADGDYQNQQEEVYQGQCDADYHSDEDDYQYVQDPDNDKVDDRYNQDDGNGNDNEEVKAAVDKDYNIVLVEADLSAQEPAYEELDNADHVEADPAMTAPKDEAVDDDDDDDDQHYDDQDGALQDGYKEPPETPDHPIKYSRFVFLSDKKTVPNDMKKLEERAMRRRHDFMTRMHDLDCQLAMATCQYAEEKMDLGLAIHDTLDRMVCNPLEMAMERVVMERETSAIRTPAVASLQRRVSQLDTHMARHIHITLNNTKRDELDGLQDHLHHDAAPGMRMENSKADRIEKGIARRFELVAGIDARRFHKESAARRAAVDTVSNKVDTRALQEEERLDDFLATVTDLRAQLRQERARRKAADTKIMDDIVKTTATMKRALLQAVGGSN